MDDLLSATELTTDTSYDIIRGGRIRVTRLNDSDNIWFRIGPEAHLPVRNLHNTGTETFYVIAALYDPDSKSYRTLKTVILIPRERLNVFLPPPQTTHLTILHVNEPKGPAILECDDIPRV
ncbi:hypothetical protein [Spirosoma montaniterrae]|uniref:Uncharacterized protein n=1 Tax=Spirosoma montaniterrae TaxID=1178516 RepID=A0A1P9WYT6_9BACT|nr:hypothetical protein [Spirosoma montaniterrae]AQG80541.1 hypothetical protein AWR27_15145 [Spirosoma montaniterrae]